VRGDIHQARQEMRTAMDQTPFNEAQVRAAYQGISPLLEDMVVLMAKIRSEIRSLLTADQIKTLDEKRAQHYQRKREQRDHFPGMMNLDTGETP
jgi:Spy/CpxP family protein refolding chaperone